jgi:hypothetical protein
MSSTYTELVKTAQEQFLAAVRQGQQAVVDSVGAWANAVEKAPTPSRGHNGPRDVPRADEVVDNVFDFAEKLLAAQREFTRNLLSAASPVVEKAEETARAAAKGAGKAGTPAA